MNDSGRCRSVKIGSGVSKKDDFQILVDTYNVYEAVQADEDMYTQTEYDAATEDMYTQAEYDAEVTATAKLQAAYDALIEAGDDAVYTQYEYEDAVWNTLSYTWTLSRGPDCHDKYRYNCDGITEYMEGICSGDVIFENTFNVAVCEQD